MALAFYNKAYIYSDVSIDVCLFFVRGGGVLKSDVNTIIFSETNLFISEIAPKHEPCGTKYDS